MAILLVGVIESNILSAQTSPYSHLEDAGSEVAFGDLKSLYQNTNRLTKTNMRNPSNQPQSKAAKH